MRGSLVFALLSALLGAVAHAQPPQPQPGEFGSTVAERELRREKNKDGDRTAVNLKGLTNLGPVSSADRCMIECDATLDQLVASVNGGPWTAIGGGGGVDGIQSLNCQTGADQYIVVTATPVGLCDGTTICWHSEGDTHTLVVPDASVTARGVVTTGSQGFAGVKVFNDGLYTSALSVGTTVEGPDEQTIGGADAQIDPTVSTFIRLIPDANYTLTAAPTILAGIADGQRLDLAIEPTSAFCLILLDDGYGGPSTGLALMSGTTRQLCANSGGITFRWDLPNGLWVEEGGAGGTGSGIATPFGVTCTTTYFEEHVTTVESAPYVATVGTIPAGATVHDCLTRTNVAVPSGYTVGVDGAPDLHGTLAGTLGETNLADPTRPGPFRNHAAQSVRVYSSDPSGFVDSLGQVTVTCVWEWCSAPTQ